MERKKELSANSGALTNRSRGVLRGDRAARVPGWKGIAREFGFDVLVVFVVLEFV